MKENMMNLLEFVRYKNNFFNLDLGYNPYVLMKAISVSL